MLLNDNDAANELFYLGIAVLSGRIYSVEKYKKPQQLRIDGVFK
jgi:hypothetical protein